MELNNLITKNKKKLKKRLGRGIGSTKGKTCGRGHKGQKSRSGVAIKSFEGGQMPLYRRLPKRGFNNFKKTEIAELNISKIQYFLEKKKLTPGNKLNLDLLKKSNLISKKYKKIKILGTGDVKSKLDVEVNYISKSAKEKIEKMGGKVLLINK